MEEQKVSFTLGLIGGILAFCSSFFIYLGSVFFDNDSNIYFQFLLFLKEHSAFYLISLFILSLIMIVFSVVSIKKPKLGGWFMISSGILFLLFSYFFGLLPFILIIIGGIYALLTNKK